jgi:hypothetical protein
MKIIKPILLVISIIIPIVSSAITIEPANIIVKSGESVTLTVNGADSGTYKWRIPAGHLSSVFGKPLSLNAQAYTEKSVQYHLPKKAGNYQVEVSVNGNKAIANITVYLDLIVSPTKLQIQAGETASLQAYGGISPFTWTAEKGQINTENTAKVTYQAPSDINNTTLQVKDAVGNVIIVPIKIIQPLSVKPESFSLQPKTSKLVNLSGGLPPFTSIVNTGKLEQEDRNLLFTAPPVYGTSIIEITDAAQQKLTIPVTTLGPFTASPSRISIDKQQNATFKIWGGEPPYQVASRRGSASCDQTGACTYTAPAQYGPDIVEVQDNKQKKLVIFITVEGGTPTILPNNPRLTPGETGIFTVEGGCISYQTKNYPYQWAWEADIITSLSENGQMIQLSAPEQEGFYKLSVKDACEVKKELVVNVTAAEKGFAISPTEIHLEPEKTTTLQARGADAVKWSSQLGQLSSLEGKRVTYIAPKNNGVDIITATNDKGESSNAIIFIGGRVTGNGIFYAQVDGSVETPNIIGVWNINNPEDKPQTKTLYVAVLMEEKGLHIITPTEWQIFNGTDIPAYQQNIKTNATKFNIMKNRDVTSLPALQIL